MSNHLNSPTLRQEIRTTLQPMGLWSANAEELLLATCAQESGFGQYRTQLGGGPARGIFQMEGEDHDDAWKNYIAYKHTLVTQLINLSPTHQTDDMINNDPYAIAMCRVHYARRPGALPDPANLTALWNYYKAQYNTASGGATETEFFSNYKEYVTDGQAR